MTRPGYPELAPFSHDILACLGNVPHRPLMVDCLMPAIGIYPYYLLSLPCHAFIAFRPVDQAMMQIHASRVCLNSRPYAIHAYAVSS